jgi:hypothetical protein
VEVPPGAGRERLSLQNGSLANSRSGTELPTTAQEQAEAMTRRFTTGTPKILNNSQAGGNDFLGRISGEANLAAGVRDALVKPSPRSESEVAQARAGKPTRPQTSLGKLVGKIASQVQRGC